MTSCRNENDILKLPSKFLVNVFVENGYDETFLRNIIKQRRRKGNNDSDLEGTNQVTLSNIVTLPWAPGLSPKLRKVFKKAGYKAVFKSGANSRTILCSKNKMKLPRNSHPGVYKLNCSCKKANVGETGCKVSTRTQQHQQSVYDENTQKLAMELLIGQKGRH